MNESPKDIRIRLLNRYSNLMLCKNTETEMQEIRQMLNMTHEEVIEARQAYLKDLGYDC